MRLRFNIRSLLIVTTVSSVCIYVMTQYDMLTSILLVFATLFAAAGYLAGWTSKYTYDSNLNILGPASVFVVLNFLLWYICHVAFFFVREATDRDLSPLLYWLAEADRRHFFDVMSCLLAAMIMFAAFKRSRRWLFTTGTVSALI